MLVNWFLSAWTEDESVGVKTPTTSNDLRTLVTICCNHLLAASVLRQLPDKDVEISPIFRVSTSSSNLKTNRSKFEFNYTIFYSPILCTIGHTMTQRQLRCHKYLGDYLISHGHRIHQMGLKMYSPHRLPIQRNHHVTTNPRPIIQ